MQPSVTSFGAKEYAFAVPPPFGAAGPGSGIVNADIYWPLRVPPKVWYLFLVSWKLGSCLFKRFPDAAVASIDAVPLSLLQRQGCSIISVL